VVKTRKGTKTGIEDAIECKRFNREARDNENEDARSCNSYMFVGQDKLWRIKIVISMFRAVAVVRRIGAQPGRTSAATPRGTSEGLKPLVVHLRHSQNQGQTRPRSHREKRV